jgi:hypothetical protein
MVAREAFDAGTSYEERPEGGIARGGDEKEGSGDEGKRKVKIGYSRLPRERNCTPVGAKFSAPDWEHQPTPGNI